VASKLSLLIREIRRRRVHRVAALYAVVGYGLFEAADLIFPRLSIPDNAVNVVLWVILAGFPIALVLAWVFDLNTTPASNTTEQNAHQTGKGSVHLPRNRVAVLPFASIHPDREHDYFAEGMTEELISAISRIQGVDVIARTSVTRYKDSDLGVAAIGEELRVGAVLEGSVRKDGDQLRVTVQLINVESEGHLWSADYDREFREVFSVQKDIATNVADALKLRLLAPDANSIGAAPTEDLAAYDLYLLGRHHLNGRVDAGIRKAISCFERAAGLDPGFAAAYAGLADAYLLAGLGYVAEPPENALDRAQEMAQRALRFEEGLAEAHTSLGYSALLRWDIGTAETELRRAVELNPSHAQAHQWLGQFLSGWLGRHGDGIQELERALELDPLSAVITTELGWVFGYMEDFERALGKYDRALEMDPNLAIAHFNRGDALQKMGRLEESIASYDRALELSPGMPWARSFRGSAHAAAGRSHLALEVLAEMEEEDLAGRPVTTFMAVLQEALGRKEDALASLQKAINNREPIAHSLSATIGFLSFPSLRGTPEFQALLDEIDLVLAGEAGRKD